MKYKRLYDKGFTFIEILISLAIISGILLTIISTVNYHITISSRGGDFIQMVNLAREKMLEIGKYPTQQKGTFQKPYEEYSYNVTLSQSSYPFTSIATVSVTRDKNIFTLKEYVYTYKTSE